MNNSEKLIGGAIALAGIATLLLCTKKGKSLQKNFLNKTNELAKNAEETFQHKREDLKESVADKVFNFAVLHRQSIGNAASIVMPYLLKNMVKKKL